ncbi:MAG TPA: hypothetical protein VKP88_00655 [Candidatus Paceibacterota bacterium]|nr:hypothetical protein [Candidatus Paceibacterota bacterium]
MKHEEYLQAIQEQFIQQWIDTLPSFVPDGVAYQHSYAEVVEDTNPSKPAGDGEVSVLLFKDDDIVSFNIPLGDVKRAAKVLYDDYLFYLS